MPATSNSTTTPIVHIVDDDDSLRTAVSRLLRVAGYEVQSHASVGAFLLARPGSVPGCVILDIRMPGPSGFDVQDSFQKEGETLPIIFLTGHGDIPLSVRAMRMGAVDFLTKPVKREVLLGAVQMAIARDAELRIERDSVRQCHQLLETLTPREQEVFAGVVAGKLNKQIAADLGTAERTVKAHRAQVMKKMQVSSVAELVRMAENLRVSKAPSSG